MDMEDAVTACGAGGSIRRESWPIGDMRLVVRVTRDDRTMSVDSIKYEARWNSFDRTTPSRAETEATDWVVVAKTEAKSSARLRLVKS